MDDCLVIDIHCLFLSIFFPSIEFIGYLIPQYEQNDCTVIFASINQQKCVGLSHYSNWLSRYPHLKLEKLKVCET